MVTYGDMVRVPGARTSLDEAKSGGGTVDVVTSPLQALDIARNRSGEQVVFLAVGFETTAPATAVAAAAAKRENLRNMTFLVSHKLVPPALTALVADKEIAISGFLLPGHVSAIIGEKPYAPLVQAGLPAVITGFEPLDILSSIAIICDMLLHKKCAVLNGYPRIVKREGNPRAVAAMNEVFDTVDALWRGIGTLPASGLAFKSEYSSLDAAKRFGIPLDFSSDDMPESCSCGGVLKGRLRPDECPQFGTSCTPEHPVGPCMVSSEGTCAAFFRYGA